MALLLGLGAALSYSGADFLGGVLSRRTGVLPVVVFSQIASLIVLGGVILATGFGQPTTQGLVWGAASGVATGVGLVTYFRGLTVGKMGLVAPTTAVIAAGVPVAAGLAFGERPSATALVGVAFALVALALVSTAPERAVQAGGVVVGVDAHDADVRAEGTVRPGLLDALGAGVLFGLFFVFLHQAGPGGPGPSGPLWPLVAATAASLAPLSVIVFIRKRPLRPAPGTLSAIVASGLLGSAGSLLFLLAAQRGMLSLAAVLAAQSPAGVTLLARVVLHERLHGLQLAGLVLALVGASLITVG